MSVTGEIFRVLLDAKAPLTLDTLMECLPGGIDRSLVQALLSQRCKAGELVREVEDGKPAYAVAPGYDASRRQERKAKSMPAAGRETDRGAPLESPRAEQVRPDAIPSKPAAGAQPDVRVNRRELPVETTAGSSLVVLAPHGKFHPSRLMVEDIARCSNLTAAWMAEGLLLGAPREVLLHLATAHQGLEAVQTLLAREDGSHG